MNDLSDQSGGNTGPTVSLSDNGLAGLFQQRMLDPPSVPGLLASLGGYDIIRAIGAGGMGLLFVAREQKSNRMVALKLIRPDLIADDRMLRRFLLEAKHMQQMRHPHILPVLDIRERVEGPFFVMPYMQRGSLAGILKPGQPLDGEITRRVARQIADALGYAHGRGILHRDLKPANILLDESGDAFLADFGLLRRFYDESLVDASRARVEGTAAYLSPAAASGRTEDTRGDIYGWGALLYEMLTGEPPYCGETSSEVIDQIIAGPPEPIRTRSPSAPNGLVVLVEGAMARELRDRYAQMADIVADLDRITAGQEPLGPNGHFRRQPGLIRRRLSAVLLLVMITVVVLVAWWWLPLSMLTPRNPSNAVDAGESDGLALMPDVTISPAPQGKLLFQDSFEGIRIDPTRWKWDQNDFSYQGRGSGNHGQVSQRNGSLLITVEAKSEGGWSSGRSVWIDASTDLKMGVDVAVRADYVVSGKLGTAQVLIAEPKDTSQSTGVTTLTAVEHKADEYHALDSRRETLGLYLHAASNSAMLNTSMGKSPATYRVIDLSNLERWHLRFMVTSATSSGFANSEMSLRLDHVQANLPVPTTLVYGRILDVDTGLPIGNVTVTGPEGQTCRVDGRGMYLLPISPERQVLLQVTDVRFDVVKDTPIVYAQLGQQVQFDIYVRRTPARYGDEVQTLTLPGHDVLSAVDAGPNDVVFVAGGGNRSSIYHMDSGAGSISDPSRFPDVTGLVRVGDIIYGVSHWPGRLYRFEEGRASPKVYELATLWPRGLGYDGKYLWTLNANQTDNKYEVWALDPETGSVAHRFSTADSGVRSITYGNDHLWIGSRSGVVYEVDPQEAIRSGNLEEAVVNQFNGVYECLSFSGAYGELWAIDSQGKGFIRINIREAP